MRPAGNKGKRRCFTSTYDADGKLASVSTEFHDKAINRNDWSTMLQAEAAAVEATQLTGKMHLPVDQGTSTWPRFDVIEAPQVGSEVSRAFNGDYYPAGKIVKVSKSFKRVATEDGTVFTRVRETASWRSAGTWYMSAGSRRELNPHF